jgi:hypothetical protein
MVTSIIQVEKMIGDYVKRLTEPNSDVHGVIMELSDKPNLFLNVIGEVSKINKDRSLYLMKEYIKLTHKDYINFSIL